MIRSYQVIAPVVPASCYVDESAQVIGDVVLAENVSIWPGAVLRGDVNRIRIGANSNLQDAVVLHGQTDLYPVELGEWVSVGHRATLHGCTVEDRCLIGIGAIVLNGARIGHDSIIAAGTLIPEHAVVEPFSLMMGSPGKLRRVLGEQEREAILMPARNYLGLRERYLRERAAKR